MAGQRHNGLSNGETEQSRIIIMKKIKTDPREGYEVYLEFCDKVFGTGTMAPVLEEVMREKEYLFGKKEEKPSFNLITEMWKYPEVNLDFKENYRKRLMRLKKRFEKTPSYKGLLHAVAEVADADRVNDAMAMLAAWDVMSNKYSGKEMELLKQIRWEDYYGGPMRFRPMQKDGYLPTFGLYFDAGVMGDGVGEVIYQVTNVAKMLTEIPEPCDIEADYPWDDNPGEYKEKSDELLNELTHFILKNYYKITDDSDEEIEVVFESEVIPRLKYTIRREEPLDFEPTMYRPYRHAEKTKDLVLKRFVQNVMRKEPFVQVLVKPAHYLNYKKEFDRANATYYRALARRTFCGYLHDERQMKELNEWFVGEETVCEVSKDLTGIVVIDDRLDDGEYTCHVFLNPNAKTPNSLMKTYLESLADKDGAFDDFMFDNY